MYSGHAQKGCHSGVVMRQCCTTYLPIAILVVWWLSSTVGMYIHSQLLQCGMIQWQVSWLCKVYNVATLVMHFDHCSCHTHGMKHTPVTAVHEVNLCTFSITFSNYWIASYNAQGCDGVCSYVFLSAHNCMKRGTLSLTVQFSTFTLGNCVRIECSVAWFYYWVLSKAGWSSSLLAPPVPSPFTCTVNIQYVRT